MSTRNNFPERGLSLEGVCPICFIIPNKIQNTKGGQIANTRDLGKILVVCLVELVSPVGHSANSVGVPGYSSG